MLYAALISIFISLFRNSPYIFLIISGIRNIVFIICTFIITVLDCLCCILSSDFSHWRCLDLRYLVFYSPFQSWFVKWNSQLSYTLFFQDFKFSIFALFPVVCARVIFIWLCSPSSTSVSSPVRYFSQLKSSGLIFSFMVPPYRVSNSCILT
jgi:hypothetical protein